MRNNFSTTKQQMIDGADDSSLHRSGHSSTAWSSTNALLQPQDGAAKTSTQQRPGRVIDISNRQVVSSEQKFAEPEDARLTGGTRSLMRRMFGLNFAARAVAKVTPALKMRGLKKPVVA